MGWTLALLVCLGSLFAFDTLEPPPKKTLGWTVSTRRPGIQFKDASLEEAVQAIMETGNRPTSYTPKIDCSQIKVLADWRISLDEKDITVIKAVAIIAEKCDADLLIKPGVIVLVPRKKG